MIVEVPVIGALAFHVLFYVKEGSFSLFELPVKQLQFSPCPFHSIPASIHLDLCLLYTSLGRFRLPELGGRAHLFHKHLLIGNRKGADRADGVQNQCAQGLGGGVQVMAHVRQYVSSGLLTL